MVDMALILVAAALFGYALFTERIANSVVSGPLLFLALGWAMSRAELAHETEPALYVLAEITLVLLLFSDAARSDYRMLLRHRHWPVRMLLIGLPLAVMLGILTGLVLLPDWPFWEIGVLAAILAPTDAALGQAVFSRDEIPPRVRHALAAECGLNDGLSLPFVLFFASLAISGAGTGGGAHWLTVAGEQVVLGAVVGGAVGLAGAAVLAWARRAGHAERIAEGIGMLALAGASYLIGDWLGGSGFVAAFAGGLAFGARLGNTCSFGDEFIDGVGRVLMLGAFLLIGAALLPDSLADIRLAEVALILASLFLVRPLAIWLSLLGSDAPPRTRLFLGWFGPRGLATALFALLVVEHEKLEVGEPILAVAIVTVAISALLHGASAAPAARRFGPRLEREASGLTAGQLPEKRPS
jgi:sodium/hydrogen antiporter